MADDAIQREVLPIPDREYAAPGYTSVRPNTCATIAEILKLNGYATAHVGKCYEVPPRPRAPRRAPSTR